MARNTKASKRAQDAAKKLQKQQKKQHWIHYMGVCFKHQKKMVVNFHMAS